MHLKLLNRVDRLTEGKATREEVEDVMVEVVEGEVEDVMVEVVVEREVEDMMVEVVEEAAQVEEVVDRESAEQEEQASGEVDVNFPGVHFPYTMLSANGSSLPVPRSSTNFLKNSSLLTPGLVDDLDLGDSDTNLWSSAPQLKIPEVERVSKLGQGSGLKVRGGVFRLGLGGRGSSSRSGHLAEHSRDGGGFSSIATTTSREQEARSSKTGYSVMSSSLPLRKASGEESSSMACFQQGLEAMGVIQVALSGVRNGEPGSMKLPGTMVAKVEDAQLLFLRCAKDGVIMATANFYLARVNGLRIFDSKFLVEWASSKSLPDLQDFQVFSSSYMKKGGRQPLQPLTELLFEHRFFCVLDSESGQAGLVRQVVKKMGGVLVPWEDRDTAPGVVYTLSEDPVEGERVYKTDWVLDMVEVGATLNKARFLMEPEEEMPCSQVRNLFCLNIID